MAFCDQTKAVRFFLWEDKEGDRLNVICVAAKTKEEAIKRIYKSESESSSILKRIEKTLDFLEPLELSEGVSDLIQRLVCQNSLLDTNLEVSNKVVHKYYRYTPSCLVYILGVGMEEKMAKKILIEDDFFD